MNDSSGKFLDADKDHGIVKEDSVDGPFDARENHATPDIGADNKFKFKKGNQVAVNSNPQDYNTGHNLYEEKKDEDTQEQFKEMNRKLNKKAYVRGQD